MPSVFFARSCARRLFSLNPAFAYPLLLLWPFELALAQIPDGMKERVEYEAERKKQCLSEQYEVINDRLTCGLASSEKKSESAFKFTHSLLPGGVSGGGMIPWLLLGGAGAGVAAAAGGGGGGGGDTVNTPGTEKLVVFPEGSGGRGDITSPDYYQTSEYRQRHDLDTIRAKEAYANIAALNGINGAVQGGKGVVIAILDTGVDTAHADLDDNILPGCSDSASCQTHYGASDLNGHGTHVAGIAAASKDARSIHGVAFNASILPGCAYVGGGCFGSPVGEGELMFWSASHGASVANMSYSYTKGSRSKVASDIIGGAPGYDDARLKEYLFGAVSEDVQSEYQKAKMALEQGLVTVLSAGNYDYLLIEHPEETSQPSVMAMAPRIYSGTDLAEDLEYQWLTVVNTDNYGVIASSSHACGDAAEFCLAAPGTSITSTMPGNQYQNLSGTSMAAPQVSGGFALVAGAFPGLELPGGHPHSSMCDSGSSDFNQKQCHSKAVVNRLLVSATDLGAEGTDPVYGRGLLNLDGATSLIGEAQIQTRAGIVHNLADSQLSPSMVIGDSVAKQLASVQFTAVDSYDKAGFQYPGNALLGEEGGNEHRVDTLSFLRRSLGADTLSTTAISQDMRFSFSRPSPGVSPGWIESDLSSRRYQLDVDLNPDTILAIGYGLQPELDFTSRKRSSPGVKGLVVSQAFNHPFSPFMDQAHSVHYRMALTDDAFFQVGLWQGEVDKNFSNQQEGMDASSLSISLTGKISQRLTGTLKLGDLNEQESFLGTGGAGIWNTDEGSQTWMTGFNLSYEVSPEIDLLLSYYKLVTKAGQSEGVLQYSDTLKGNSFSTGLLAEVDSSWQYGLFITQPLRVSQGEALLELPYGYHGSELAYQQVNIDLAPSGRHLEYELAAGWRSDSLPLSGKVNLIRVSDYGNRAGNDDWLMLFNIGLNF